MVKHRIIVFAPLVLLPLLLLGPEQPLVGRMAWIVGVMAIFWATEALPVAVSSMLPLVLLPALGIMPAERVANNYWKDMCVLFFGGLVVAAALEAVGLHRRIALKVLLTCGSKPVQLLLGFMSATAFLSMWMSNTATTAMMMPIVEAVLQQLEAAAAAGESAAAAAAGEAAAGEAAAAAGDSAAAREAAAAGTTGAVAGAVEGVVAGGAAGPPRAVLGRVGKALVLGVAYAANIGGMATLTGTGPNLILAGDLAALFPAAPGLSFAAWLAFAFPLALVLLLLCWALLCLVHLRRVGALYDPKRAAAAIRTQYEQLGPPSYPEVAVGVDFVLLALLWISRDPKVLPGWGAAFAPGHVTDGTVAIAMALVLFALPSRPPCRPAAVARAVCLARGYGVRNLRAEINLNLRAEIEPTAPASELVEATGTAACAPVSAVVSRTAAVHRRFEALRDSSPDAGGEEAAAAAAAAARAGAASGTRPRASEGEALVSWPQVQARLPWGVLLLFGGGFAVADGCAVSGISARVGENLSVLHSLPPPASAALLMLVVSCSTAVTSNVATASIFVPVVAALAETMRLHPLYLMMPVALTCSLAFVLPVSTPPNAMAFATGRIQVADMVGVGLALNAIGIVVVLVGLLTSGTAIFGLDELPHWVNASGEDVALESS